MPDIYQNLRAAYQVLSDRVTRVLHTQLGDAGRLQAQQDLVLQYLQTAEEHQNRSNIFPPAEFARLRSNISEMLDALDDARHLSSDQPVAPTPVIVRRVYTGCRGRPRIEIDPAFLETALQYRGPTHIAPVLDCSSRTVRRRGVEGEFLEPGDPVFAQRDEPDGTSARIHTSTTRPVSTLSDDELDAVVSSILESFPDFGRRMLSGSLVAMGHRVPRKRLAESYVRVHGAPGVFGDRHIHRKIYRVAAANSLWHHDGQHGLIRYKIVIHCFIDGKSRFVVGIGAHNNNRSQTVFDLFAAAASEFGVPCRIRGDHGTENIMVAAFMEDFHGPGQGAYIWGRSVHNTRIERLWYDVTHGFGQKWKNFFVSLETQHGLNPTIPAHIWLLQHLFLSAINNDAIQWANSWNSHTLNLRGERDRSPADIYFFSTFQDGPRGQPLHQDIADVEDPLEDPAAYGIDWDVADNNTLMAHLLENNPQEWDETNPFCQRPSALSHVPCESPNCPFTPDQVAWLDEQIDTQVDRSTSSMDVRRTIWIVAFGLCTSMYTN